MTHLRHVRCDGAHLPDPTTVESGFYRKNLVLEGLQTLSGLWNLVFTKEMLQSILNIEKIDVLYDKRFLLEKEWACYQLENLGNLHQLKALKIRVNSFNGIYKYLDSPPMSNFRFPPSLKKLTPGGVRIPWHELATIGSLPNLEVLKLINHACLGTEWKPNDEEFCKLQVLVLENLDLKQWTSDSNHFPSLQRLIIRWCDNLVEIPCGIGESTTLTMIELEGFKDFVLHSAKEILEKQQSYGNYDGFKVKCHKRSVRRWRNLAEQVTQK